MKRGMTPWEAYRKSMYLGIAALACLLFGRWLVNEGPSDGHRIVGFVIFGVGVVLFIIGLVIEHRHWRCPHCGTRLPSRVKDLTYCQSCGREIEESDI